MSGADRGNPDGGDAVPPAVAARLHVNENDDTHGGRAPNVVDQGAAFTIHNLREGARTRRDLQVPGPLIVHGR